VPRARRVVSGSAGAAIAAACALLAATAYGVASVLQAVGVARASSGGALGASLVREWRYLLGIGLDLLGFVAAVVALQRLPLFFVQAAAAGSVGITALVAARWLGSALSPVEARAVVALIAGLVLLAAAARPEPPIRLSDAGQWALLAGTTVALAGILGAAQRKNSAVLAVVAGLGFSGSAIGARSWVLPHSFTDLVTDPVSWALVLYGVLGAGAFAVALEHGRVTTVAAVTFVVETCLPAAVGLALLGDRPRAGLVPVAAVGFVLAIAASLRLARYVEPAVRGPA